MTENEIRFNYDKAMAQADELRDIASSIKDISDDELEESFGKVGKNWTGDNSESYVKKGQKVQKKVNGTATGVKAAAAALETMAKNIYNAEMAAIQIVKAGLSGKN